MAPKSCSCFPHSLTLRSKPLNSLCWHRLPPLLAPPPPFVDACVCPPLTPPPAQLYYYESHAGALFITVRLASVAWFNYAARTTLKQFRKKKGFYTKFIAFFSLWLAAMPVIIFLCSFCADWFRLKIVFGSQLAYYLMGQAVLCAMYNPDAKYNKSFPFHAMTTAMMTNAPAPGANVQDGRGGGHLGSDSLSSAAQPGKIPISNPFERQHVAELKSLSNYIDETVQVRRASRAAKRAIVLQKATPTYM